MKFLVYSLTQSVLSYFYTTLLNHSVLVSVLVIVGAFRYYTNTPSEIKIFATQLPPLSIICEPIDSLNIYSNVWCQHLRLKLRVRPCLPHVCSLYSISKRNILCENN